MLAEDNRRKKASERAFKDYNADTTEIMLSTYPQEDGV